MLDPDAGAQTGAPFAAGHKLAQAVVQPLVLADPHQATTPGPGLDALRAHVAAVAGGGVELDHHPEAEGLLLARRAGDRTCPHVEVEVRLAEGVRIGVRRRPGAAEDLPAS